MDDLTPEQLQVLMELGIIPDQLQGVDQQLEVANQLRSTPIPKGGMAGRVYVGDPMGAAAAGYDRYRGGKQAKQLQGERKGLLDQQVAGRKTYAQMIADQLRARTQPPGAQPSGAQTFPVQ